MQAIIDYVQENYGRNLNSFSDSFLRKTVNQRITETGSVNLGGYLEYLRSTGMEVEKLTDSLNLSYSLFFRSMVDFSILERVIFPLLLSRNQISGKSVRIWSAACAEGQEPYSVAMITDDLIQAQFPGSSSMILATDISEIALGRARKGEYATNSVQNVKLSYIMRYFTNSGRLYLLNENVKKKVEFTTYDLLDPVTSSPPSGIFGGFDIIICCNLLIYYKAEFQKAILKKVYGALSDGGYLIVDESEKSIIKSYKGFHLFSNVGNIFIKNV
jgi:chemotaxis protein methyltransferase CheR